MGYIFGLDPGAASGALAWLDKSGALVGIDNAEGYDEGLPLRLVEHFKYAELLVVEKILPYGQGKASPPVLMGLAASAATAVGVARAMGVPVVLVQTSIWKRAMSVTSDKLTSIARANELFGERHWLMNRSKNKAGEVRADQNHAEAALIALYGLKSRGEGSYG
jgi:hypothetical protein